MHTSTATTSERAPIRVSASQRLHSPAVGYVDQTFEQDQDDIAFGSFNGVRRALNADVLHLHRLDSLGGSRRLSGKDRVTIALALAMKVKRDRVALVRTWHGADARGAGGRSGKLANWILNRVTSQFVVVDASTPKPGNKPTTLIPYGHYRDRFVGYPVSERVQGRVLSVAPHLVENIEMLANALNRSASDNLSLRVVGPTPADREEDIEKLATEMPVQVSTRIERVSDGAMVEEITAAQLVVVTRVAELDDLHTVFLALSLDRPVLVPDNPLTRNLAKDVGAGWVHRYKASLEAADVDKVFDHLRANPPEGRPNLEGRDRATTAQLYADVFISAATRTRRR